MRNRREKAEDSKNRTLDDIPGVLQDSSLNRLRRNQLVAPKTLIKKFNEIHNYLAGNAAGMTREIRIISEIIRILYCKIYDEISKKPEESVDFWSGNKESPSEVADRIHLIFQSVKKQEPDIFENDEKIEMDDESVNFVVKVLQDFELTGAGRDVLGEAFETITGPALRGGDGQFFTPRNLARLAVVITNPKPHEKIIDPACGAAGFLIEAYGYMFNGQITNLEHGEERNLGGKIIGIDKDAFLAKIARVQLRLSGSRNSQILCENSLLSPAEWTKSKNENEILGSFDVVITNPPFGNKIPVTGDRILKQYALAKEWKIKRGSKVEYIQTEKLKISETPQILFIERCLDLIKDGGRMAIVLPEGILGNANTGFVRKFIRDRAEIIAIIDCPLETFLPSTPTKTCLLVLRKTKKPHQKEIFMAIAEKCGHDRRGVPLFRPDGTPDDDFPDIGLKFNEFKREHNVPF